MFQGFQSLDEATVYFEGVSGAMLGPFDRLKVERGSAVVVLVHDLERDAFLFVRQFRYPCVGHGDPWLMELVAGMIDKGESPEEAAIRETCEEAGFNPKKLEAGPTFFSTPGGSSEFMHGYYAPVTSEDQIGDGGGVDHGEDLELVWLPHKDAIRAAMDGEIKDGKSLVMLLWFAVKQMLD